MTGPSPLDEMDRNMVVLFQQGDKNDYLKLYNRYAPAVLGVLTRTLGNQKLAEQCVNESFCQIWAERLNYDPAKERLFTWMLKIAKNCALFGALTDKNNIDDEIREEIDLVYAMDIKTYLHTKSNEEGLRFAEGIDLNIRQAIYLIYFENCSFAKTAAKLEMSVSVLREKMVKTIKQLTGSVLA